MEMKSKTVSFFIFFFVIFGAIVCQNIQAAGSTPSELREWAGILEKKIKLCERDLSQGTLKCDVRVPWENRIVSIAEAKNLVEQYLKEAQKSEFYSILNDPNRRSEPIDAPYTNDLNDRSTYKYAEVIKQFQVTTSKRYQNDENTYCNIFVWDVTMAMGAEIPHWSKEKKEMRVYQIVAWLKKEGREKGWSLVSSSYAQQMANEGKPTIAIWNNPKNNKGHVAIVRPGSIGFPDGPAIAQAGNLIVNADHLNDGFNDPNFRKDIKLWYHK